MDQHHLVTDAMGTVLFPKISDDLFSAGKEAKTGLLICLFRQSCGSSESTLDHRT